MCKFIKLLLISALVTLFISPVNASTSYIVDEADILSNNEEIELDNKLMALSDEYGLDFVILSSAEDIFESVDADAKAMYEDAGFDEGVALYINTKTNEFYLFTNGETLDEAFNQNEKRLMLVAITEIYKNEDEDAYVKIAESFIKNAEFYYLDNEDAERDPLLVDDAGLFNEYEIEELTAMLEEQSLIKDVDFVVYTTDVYPENEEKIEAADYYDYHNYSKRGYMLYINMASRYLFILTTGEDIKTGFVQSDIDIMTSTVASNLTDENYYQAVVDFIDLFDEYYSPVEPDFDMSKRDPLITDKAHVLNETENISLTTDLVNKSSEEGFDITVYIDDNADVDEPSTYAETLYDQLYYRDDGLMLYMNIANDQVTIIKAGWLNVLFDGDEFDELLNEFEDMMREGSYAEIIQKYVDGSADIHQQILDDLYKEDVYNHIRTVVLASFGISGVITIIVAFILFRQTRSFKLQSNANNYATNEGSYFSKANIRVSKDIFLYRTRRKDYSPEQHQDSGGGSGSGGGGSDSFTGSSGESHGGGGSSF